MTEDLKIEREEEVVAVELMDGEIDLVAGGDMSGNISAF